jgi:hypothetical protein
MLSLFRETRLVGKIVVFEHGFVLVMATFTPTGRTAEIMTVQVTVLF